MECLKCIYMEINGSLYPFCNPGICAGCVCDSRNLEKSSVARWNPVAN